MRIGALPGGSSTRVPTSYGEDFAQTIEQLMQFEDAGLERVMIPEAYGFDAVTQMGFVAARTSVLELAFGILPMFSRTPTNLAMTAAGLDYVSDDDAFWGSARRALR